MPPRSSPRQVLVATITAAHAAGDLATAQIVAGPLTKRLNVPEQALHVAPVVDLASVCHARS
ncbi:hypothetical protein [Sorangium cellulosum]|nr:hypothetical protein [Sorangium cellulosum]